MPGQGLSELRARFSPSDILHNGHKTPLADDNWEMEKLCGSFRGRVCRSAHCAWLGTHMGTDSRWRPEASETSRPWMRALPPFTGSARFRLGPRGPWIFQLLSPSRPAKRLLDFVQATGSGGAFAGRRPSTLDPFHGRPASRFPSSASRVTSTHRAITVSMSSRCRGSDCGPPPPVPDMDLGCLNP